MINTGVPKTWVVSKIIATKSEMMVALGTKPTQEAPYPSRIQNLWDLMYRDIKAVVYDLDYPSTIKNQRIQWIIRTRSKKQGEDMIKEITDEIQLLRRNRRKKRKPRVP